MSVRKTRAGWIVETTHMHDGCLEQGGVCGREELYNRATLARLGIDYDVDPQESVGCIDESITNEQYLEYAARPDKIIRTGAIIE